jgi:hypothetical protein
VLDAGERERAVLGARRGLGRLLRLGSGTGFYLFELGLFDLGLDPRGQCLDGGRSEQVAQPQVDAEPVAQRPEHPGGEQ